MNYYFDVLKKYAELSGRARRKEYWMFYLCNAIICFALGFIEGVTGINSGDEESLFAFIYTLAVFVPTIAVGIRRMHDVNRSGWYIVLPIVNLILLVTGGTKGANKYGPDPKEVKAN